MLAKNGLIFLETVLVLKNVKITGEVASVNQETTHEFPDAIKIITEEKGYLFEHVF